MKIPKIQVLNQRILDFKFWILVKQRGLGEPVRWAASHSCCIWRGFPHERLHQAEGIE